MMTQGADVKTWRKLYSHLLEPNEILHDLKWVEGNLPTKETKPMLTIIESPYAAANGNTISQHVAYAQACLKDVLDRGDSPMASHLLMTQAYDDADEDERQLGMEAGWAWMQAAGLVAVYTDLGLTGGMMKGIERASELGTRVEFRELEEWSDEPILHFPMPKREGDLYQAWYDPCERFYFETYRTELPDGS